MRLTGQNTVAIFFI